jgi:ABC-type multidrug transport system ATPase subunit
MLDLQSCRNTVIGNALRRGISGGQAKRVNIGLALVQRPPVLILGEI